MSSQPLVIQKKVLTVWIVKTAWQRRIAKFKAQAVTALPSYSLKSYASVSYTILLPLVAIELLHHCMCMYSILCVVYLLYPSVFSGEMNLGVFLLRRRVPFLSNTSSNIAASLNTSRGTSWRGVPLP